MDPWSYEVQGSVELRTSGVLGSKVPRRSI
jgi:hypothetical protein